MDTLLYSTAPYSTDKTVPSTVRVVLVPVLVTVLSHHHHTIPEFTSKTHHHHHYQYSRIHTSTRTRVTPSRKEHYTEEKTIILSLLKNTPSSPISNLQSLISNLESSMIVSSSRSA